MPVVLITGASRGIGRATAFAFARDCWCVAVNYCHSEKQGLEVVEAIRDFGGLACPIPGDVRDPQACQAMVRQTVDTFGPLDALVNNAGISLPGQFQDVSPAMFAQCLATNLEGPRNMIAAALPGMLERKRGAIVNVSSMWGVSGASCESAYSASKAGLIGLSKALARELGPCNIRVNCVAPGVIETDMMAAFTAEDKAALAEETPVGRLGTADEVAKLLVFLAGEDAGYITGQVFGVNGGLVI